MIDFKIMQAGQCRHLECMAHRGGRLKMVPFPALFFLLVHRVQGPCLIDTGYGASMADALTEFPFNLYGRLLPVDVQTEETAAHRLRQIGINPSDIRHIIITHFHVDHVGGLRDFPKATFWSASSAWNSVRSLHGIKAVLNGYFPSMIPENFDERHKAIETLPVACTGIGIEPLDKGFDLFGDGTVLLVPMPGHARGQCGAIVRTADGGQEFVIADACWSSIAFRKRRMPNVLAYPFLDHLRDYRRTLGALHNLHNSNTGIRILPSHCAEVARLQELPHA